MLRSWAFFTSVFRAAGFSPRGVPGYEELYMQINVLYPHEKHSRKGVTWLRKLQTWHWLRVYDAFRRCAACSIFLFGLFTVGCSEKPSTDMFDPADSGMTVEAQEGPVSLSLSIMPTKPDTSNPARLIIQAIADESVTLTLDNYILALRDTDTYYDYRLVLRHQETAAPLVNGQLRWRVQYDMAFALAGEYEFPPASVTFESASIDRQTTTSTNDKKILKTKSLAVIVVDTIDNEMTPEQWASIKTLSPVELPQTWSRWWWLGPLLALAGLVMLGLLLYLAGIVFPPARRLLSWLRRRIAGDVQVEREEIIPAHIWARRALAALLAEDLLSQGLLQPFYYRISDIMRGYIERRFDLHAPDMTTEEFLVAAGDDPRFPLDTTRQLETFLEACDLVKYARMQPDLAQADQLVSAAERFVDTTHQQETCVDIASVAAAESSQGVAA